MTKVFVIAEAGVNHNGSLDIAKELVLKAADIGADAVKFQTFNAEHIVTGQVEKAGYQLKSTGTSGSQLNMLKELELSHEDHWALVTLCQDVGIKFLSTAFDLASFKLLAEDLMLDTFKIPSGEITNAPLLLQHGLRKQKVILSTGMASLSDVEAALAILSYGYAGLDPSSVTMEACFDSFYTLVGQEALKKNVTLLLCTSEYPAPYENINLRSLKTLSSAFGLSVGISDHSLGFEIPIAAVALGANLVEKHFTLDKSMNGPDHQSSIEPSEFRQMVQSIRNVEVALGNGILVPSAVEIANRKLIRKKIVAAKKINDGDVYSEENITVKRSKTGISAMRYWDFIGKKSTRSFDRDDSIIE